MGVAFAEVSPDICFCVNTRRHRGVVSAAAGGVRHCNAGGLHAGSVGMGTA
ncbi:phosphatidate cytidylyltransferase domain protein [Escherichia coli 2-460-02_S3_C2]|nr:phosphatidate cytidylyltransferase domain protein [Escherichia coli 2-460-02_S3_C2]